MTLYPKNVRRNERRSETKFRESVWGISDYGDLIVHQISNMNWYFHSGFTSQVFFSFLDQACTVEWKSRVKEKWGSHDNQHVIVCAAAVLCDVGSLTVVDINHWAAQHWKWNRPYNLMSLIKPGCSGSFPSAVAVYDTPDLKFSKTVWSSLNQCSVSFIQKGIRQ